MGPDGRVTSALASMPQGSSPGGTMDVYSGSESTLNLTNCRSTSSSGGHIHPSINCTKQKSLTTTTNCKSKNRAEIPTTDYKTGEKTKRESTGHMIPKSLLLR
ncbi:hypothetical protein CEXT_223831 [Caerostris extrusa]|uniref:Uncharacterized protein n=1 Tax=Caerostris extrusa TaxID=172846 RepID=A0AAV4MWC4_CAEEX|nr:hypothetical protein CEXT_223831 [Caerostris extrusa]